MSKVTSKLQVTIPKAVAELHGIVPGSEIVFESAGESIRVHRVCEDTVEYQCKTTEIEFRLRLFDEATERQQKRVASQRALQGAEKHRGWKRADLYSQGNGKDSGNDGNTAR